jgi:hypothetical protein
MKFLNIAVGFDGVIAAASPGPSIGHDLGAAPWLQLLQNHPQISLTLFTRREHKEHDDAVRWCNHKDIWFEDLPGIAVDLLVDTSAVGVPLIADCGGSAFVDWEKAGPMIMDRVGHWLLNNPRTD